MACQKITNLCADECGGLTFPRPVRTHFNYMVTPAGGIARGGR